LADATVRQIHTATPPVDVRPAPAGTGLVLVVAIVALAWSRFVRLWDHLLAGRALELVQQLWTPRRLHCPYLFHGADCESAVAKVSRYGCLGDFKKAWAAACKAAGFPIGRKHGGFVFHNTRHNRRHHPRRCRGPRWRRHDHQRAQDAQCIRPLHHSPRRSRAERHAGSHRLRERAAERPEGPPDQ